MERPRPGVPQRPVVVTRFARVLAAIEAQEWDP